MRHKFPVLTVKKLLKSVSIYGSYRKNKTGVPFFLEHPVCGHDPPTSRMDRQMTCDRRTALCTIVHRTVKTKKKTRCYYTVIINQFSAAAILYIIRRATGLLSDSYAFCLNFVLSSIPFFNL